MSIFDIFKRKRPSGESKGPSTDEGPPAIVHREAGGAMVLIRGAMVDAMSTFMAAKGGGLGLDTNVAMLAGGFAGIGSQGGLLAYKRGDASVQQLATGKDALSGAGSSWDQPCYLVMFRGC